MGGCAIPEVGLEVLESAAVRNRTPDHPARSYSIPNEPSQLHGKGPKEDTLFYNVHYNCFAARRKNL